MKKALSCLLVLSVFIPLLCACSGKEAPVTERFASKSVISGLLSAYLTSVEKNLLLPESDANAVSDAEYTYKTEDGDQIAHTALNAAYKAETKALSLRIGDHIFTSGGSLTADGAAVRSITGGADIQSVFDVFIKAFCSGTEHGDYAEAPDSIRASDTDVEVTRITLRLSEGRYERALEKAVDAVLENRETKRYLTDLCGFYGFLHNKEEDAETLLNNAAEEFRTSAKAGGELIWQRYLFNGKTVAARIKYGDNLIRYLCAETNDYTELDFEARINGKETAASYLSRRTGMSDSYNIRIARGDEITYFDGLAESAYRSGKIKFELRASKNAETVNGLQTELDFNGVTKLRYSGGGSVVRNGNKKTFTFDFAFSTASDLAAPEPGGETEALYEAAKKVFG